MDGILETGVGRRAERIFAVGIGVSAVAGLVMVVGIEIATLSHARTDKAYWTVSGPPCPVATPAEIHRIGRPLAQVSDFGEGRFARISGAVECNDVTDGVFGVVKATVCQFSRPRALGVWSEGGDQFYDFRNGERATVTASRTQPPRCVLAAHYTGD
jgi:hypothetical protein